MLDLQSPPTGQDGSARAWPARRSSEGSLPPWVLSLAQKKHLCSPTHEGRALNSVVRWV